MADGDTTRFFVVDLDQKLTGYRRFLSAWVCRSGDLDVVVDPGPTSTAAHLVNQLRLRGIRRLDYVLLTHIHLDHGGGSAVLLDAYPEAKVWCHPKGARHLVDPEKLWHGSVATIGDVATCYGEPGPVGKNRLASDGDLSRSGIEVIMTPGHAPHHASFLIGGILFAGEAVATRVRAGGAEYLRPATPHRFLPDVFFESLKKLETLEPTPRRLAFAHYGVSCDVSGWCRRAERQLRLWMREVEQARIRGESYRPDDLVSLLKRKDPDFATLDSLDPDIQERELFYVKNSLNGIWKSFD